MPVEPVIYPLSIDENIYALFDERGNTIGTGTREVCEVLLFIITKSNRLQMGKAPVIPRPAGSNVRAANTI
jgi:hypothetical protein